LHACTQTCKRKPCTQVTGRTVAALELVLASQSDVAPLLKALQGHPSVLAFERKVRRPPSIFS